MVSEMGFDVNPKTNYQSSIPKTHDYSRLNFRTRAALMKHFKNSILCSQCFALYVQKRQIESAPTTVSTEEFVLVDCLEWHVAQDSYFALHLRLNLTEVPNQLG